jgi:sensor histidine kinase regulating citrate/malate metabolism
MFSKIWQKLLLLGVLFIVILCTITTFFLTQSHTQLLQSRKNALQQSVEVAQSTVQHFYWHVS